jgi:transposase-like protein|tara:strand:+ start:196 stop:1245 length:1050 start_codon:yes stop_codon:yes gene_type:complete
MQQKIICKKCNSSSIIKKGIKKKKLQSIQRYFCKDCNSIFTLSATKSTYPIQTILKAVSHYNLGYNLSQVQKMLESRTKIKIPTSTISNWINQHKNTCTFARLRKIAIKQYSQKNIIQKQALNHIQPYTFKHHQAKLDYALKENPKFSKLKEYIEKINSKQFPHHIFTYNKDNSNKENKNNQRASKIKFNHLKIAHIKKQNLANKLTALALNLAKNNQQRHQAIQDFFLINDSTTIAAELPIYLTNWDAGYYKNQKGFTFPLNNCPTPITGHIDLLQIRNGLIHILDYKPEAEKINATEQLTLYSLALSRKLNLKLTNFKAAWFDENNYHEFFPLHAVYGKKQIFPLII